MTIAIEPTAAATIVPLQGQINSANAAAIEAQVLALVDGGTKNLILDFAGLDYISSAGLRVVLVAAKRLKPLGGKLAVYGMQPQVKEVFEISGFLRILEIAHSREDAIRRVA